MWILWFSVIRRLCIFYWTNKEKEQNTPNKYQLLSFFRARNGCYDVVATKLNWMRSAARLNSAEIRIIMCSVFICLVAWQAQNFTKSRLNLILSGSRNLWISEAWVDLRTTSAIIEYLFIQSNVKSRINQSIYPSALTWPTDIAINRLNSYVLSHFNCNAIE